MVTLVKDTLTEPKVLDITKVMALDYIVGALIWSVWHGELTDELIALVDTLPDEYVRTLEGDLGNMVKMTQGCNLDPEMRQSVIEIVRDEIVTTIDPEYHIREREQ